MAGMPREPEAFAERVATLLREIHPGVKIQLSGPREILVNGRRLDLENVYRMVATEPTRGDEIVRHYLEQLFAEDATNAVTMTLDFARPRIMPRIQPESIFDHLDRQMVAHVPFVNGTVIVFVTDLPQMTVSITTEQTLRWGLDIDEVERIARANLQHYTSELEVQFIESKEGGRAAIVSEQDGYDAARLLLGGLWERLAPQLGGDFLVATPARDMFIALSRDPREFVNRVGGRVSQDYRRLPYPITSDFFYVTRDGIAGTRPEREANGEAA
ncbi:MAG: DUF1444 family protein [Phycisphaeraceae bacterium]|nr:DUF1444 family protein [Phycisphaeraceae bacterium]